MYFSDQIRQIKKKKKLQRKARWRRRRKKKKRKKIFNGWQKKRETYAQGEACSSMERAELREEMRGMELACVEQRDEMKGMRHYAWDSEDTLPFIEGQFGNFQLTPNRYIKSPRTFNKMDHQTSKYQTRVLFTNIKRNFFPKSCVLY